MTALPYQPVPTAHQRREPSRWVSKHYPVRQYEQTQALISPVEAAGVACCDVTPEPSPEPFPTEDKVIAAFVGAVAVFFLIAHFWGIA